MRLWKRVALLAAAGLLVVACGDNGAATGRAGPGVVKGSLIACASLDDHEKIVRLELSKDREAAVALATSLAAKGLCRLLQPGTQVVVGNDLGAVRRVHLLGESAEWWTNTEHIERAAR